MINVMEGQVGLFDLDTSFGRMLPGHSVPTAAKTSRPSSPRSQGSPTPKLPTCLCLTRGGGASQGVSTAKWETSRLLGDFTTRSFGEQPNMLMAECSLPALPNGVSVSRLSQILEDCPHPRYCLSATACAGILRRANNRGKELPPQLEEALKAQIERERERESS